MIYRIHLRSFGNGPDAEEIQELFDGKPPEFSYMMIDAMVDMGFKSPRRRHKVNPRSRFYFTERGWDELGRHLLAIAIKRGYKPKVIRKKNPKASDVSFWDAYQVAVMS